MASPNIHIRSPSTLSPNPRTSTTAPTFHPPPLPFLSTTWHITHSTLPMWRSKRNVTITYTPLPPPSTSSTSSTSSTAQHTAAAIADKKSSGSPPTDLPQLDDLVRSQDIGKEKVHEVHGIDTASGKEGEEGTGSWEWRGRGALMVAGSHWEVLGWGPQNPPQNLPQNPSSTASTHTVLESAGGGVGGQNTGGGQGEAGEVEEAWLVIYFAKTLFTSAGVDILSKRKEGMGKEALEGVLEGLRGVGEGDEGFGGLVGELFEVRRD